MYSNRAMFICVLCFLEVSWNQYLVKVLKNTTRCERIACTASTIALIISGFLILYFLVIAKNTSDKPTPDTAPHEWNITREMWLAEKADCTYNDEYKPLRLVIINHSVSPECHNFINCAAELRNMQTWFLNHKGYDIPYNFFIGNDGRVYEGRGWRVVGAHTVTYNVCSLGIGFVGDYRQETANSKVTDNQIVRFKMLLQYGVEQGYLHPNYTILGGRDIDHTSKSPGPNLYNVMKSWSHYKNHTLNCSEIHAVAHALHK